ncbi:hypothetical protein A3K93_04390 [Acinetobacter sp. NCu2D-2]|uniref:MCR_0457 family protein n=1 Tax=Acinetobacter sp. NCu2D-2 TaxID=1608473 RepID=UPI0007CDD49E|nr:hypothetical protein [Acinetobacter sp. NCu2D-2]ANF81502.1 hypothetical protein A3K93_04390 [Acinetobacter sp. NCu2D-2]
MIQTKKRAALIALITGATFSPVFAAPNVEQAEENTILKENLASVQVLKEVCPAITGSNPSLEQKAQLLTQTYLSDFQGVQFSFEQLQLDAEYKTLLNTARQDAKQVNAAEQKAACEDLVAYEAE